MALIRIKFFEDVPVRFNLWIMMFTCCWMAYMLRVNMSLNIIAMVPQVARNRSSSECGGAAEVKNVSIEEPKRVQTETFNWTSSQQALILGSYFWSYPITSFMGGPAAERWGPRYVVLISSVTSVVLTALCPIASRWHYMFLVVLRFLLGFAGGVVYPALHVLVARWAPPAEKGKFTSATMGGTLGTVVTWSLTGPLMDRFGWPSAFYVPATITLLWCILWWYLVADTPEDHPRISDAEKKYIKDALGDKIQKSKRLPPFLKIACSLPFWAMTILHYGNLWGLYFIMTVGPKFMSSVLGFELSAAGVVSALPYLARLLLATVFGFIGDFILARNILTNVKIRKSFCVFSHIIPGILLIVLVYIGCSTVLSVALITLSMGFNGAATLTNLQNHQDLAPNFAGTLYGIANCIGSSAGFFTPMITAYYTRDRDGFQEWRPVFFIGASVYIIAAIFFIIFGSATTQSWNYLPEEDKTEKKEEKMNNDQKGTPLNIMN